MTNKTRFFLALLTLILASAALVLALTAEQRRVPRLNSGVILMPAEPLPDFELVSDSKGPYTKAELRGKWHILSYGYTYCPDVCPTTLFTLTQLGHRLDEFGRYQDLDFLFYTIDPNRDTQDKLAEYVAFFGDKITGIRQARQPLAQVFEQALGIKAQIRVNNAGPEEYRVSHGVTLYLINPRAELQAVFTPQKTPLGVSHFDLERLFEDYLTVRRDYLSETGKS
ncbi:SCO family protein [Shewanella sp. AS16]|uniref:SCO family protein n=1 Tax=Shewanella sp. AS16 TaxID=2907625 RepID=UPI001F45D73B|nr:SCO family protein [Shewanella sp. AS16]MCE9687335.1 SCO family protein [Shewanella sp. AS16]